MCDPEPSWLAGMALIGPAPDGHPWLLAGLADARRPDATAAVLADPRVAAVAVAAGGAEGERSAMAAVAAGKALLLAGACPGAEAMAAAAGLPAVVAAPPVLAVLAAVLRDDQSGLGRLVHLGIDLDGVAPGAGLAAALAAAVALGGPWRRVAAQRWPSGGLAVHLDGDGGIGARLAIGREAGTSARVTLVGTEGTLMLETVEDAAAVAGGQLAAFAARLSRRVELAALAEAIDAAAAGQPRRLLAAGVFVHPTACIDDAVEIGAATRIWHFTHLLPRTRIGAGCNIGQNVVIGPDVTVGDRCKIQNNVSVYPGVELEEGVFCGPSMVFTNVMNPRAEIERKHEFRSTLVRRGASIGANATIVCGVTVGRWAFVGAGAVVTRDVPDHALVVGNPARILGWVCACGVRLPDRDWESAVCPACGTAHRRTGTGVAVADS